MGYIFDALNRAGDNDPKRKKPDQPVVTNDPTLKLSQLPGEPGPQGMKFQSSAPAATYEAAEETSFVVAPSASDVSMFDDRLVVTTEPASIMAEEYRSIRTSLLARWKNRRHLVHTITSATPQEGKTITSLNLGLSFAELRNRSTIVVEADLRLPQFHKLIELGEGPGLIELLRGEAQLKDVIRTVGENKLQVIPAGRRVNNEAVQLLSSTTADALIKQLRHSYDHVVIDTPPVVELADAGIVGALSDDVLMIARMNRTPRTLIEQAIRTLESYNAKVAGMIATDQRRTRRKYYYYKYGYQYNYRSADREAA